MAARRHAYLPLPLPFGEMERKFEIFLAACNPCTVSFLRAPHKSIQCSPVTLAACLCTYKAPALGQGRALKAGDLLPLGAATAAAPGLAVPAAWRPAYPEAGSPWEVRVLPGPNAAPDYFTEADIQTLNTATYTVHYNSCAHIPSASPPYDRPCGLLSTVV